MTQWLSILALLTNYLMDPQGSIWWFTPSPYHVPAGDPLPQPRHLWPRHTVSVENPPKFTAGSKARIIQPAIISSFQPWPATVCTNKAGEFCISIYDFQRLNQDNQGELHAISAFRTLWHGRFLSQQGSKVPNSMQHYYLAIPSDHLAA